MHEWNGADLRLRERLEHRRSEGRVDRFNVFRRGPPSDLNNAVQLVLQGLS